MKRKDIFDLFEHADDETIEMLSEIPVLSDEDKERMFSASKRKAEGSDVPENGAKIVMMETLINKKASGASDTAASIRRRNRAVMNIAAACLILVIGGTVVLNTLGKDGSLLKTDKGSDDPAAQSADSGCAGNTDPDKDSNADAVSGTSSRYKYNSSGYSRRYNVSGVVPQNEEYIDYEITDEEQLDRIDEVLDEIEKIKDECATSTSNDFTSDDLQGILLNTTDDVQYFIKMVGDQPYLTINFVDYEIPQELIDQLMAVIAPTATGQYAEALRLLDALNVIDKLAGGADAVCEEATNDGYAKITECSFASVDEIRNFMNSNLTADFINALYSGVTETERPMYTTIDGEMYLDTYAKRECGYNWTDTELIISDVTATSFCATAEYTTADGTSQLKLYIVNDSDTWKISGIEFL